MCLVRVTDGTHLVGTTANRTTYGRCVGIAATAGDVSNPTVIMIEAGIVEPSVTGLAVGVESWVRVSATGTLERVTPGGGDDIIGKAHADGSVQLSPGTWDSANYAGGGGGGFTPPTGTGFASVTAGALDAASIKVNLASATYVSGTLPVGNGGTGVASLTVPASGLLVGTTDTQTLTGKTIAGASNTLSVRIANDVTGLGANVATFLATPSGANLGAALTSALTVAKGGTGLTSLTIPASALLVGTTDAQTLTNKTLTTPVINGQMQGPVVAIAALAIDWTLSTGFTKTLGAGGNTFTFSNQASNMSITVRLISNGGGSTVTWPTVKWAAGAAPTQTSTGTDVYTFWHDGTSVYGSVVQAMA